MNSTLNHKRTLIFWFLFVPVVVFFYGGLLIMLIYRYGMQIDRSILGEHVLHFSVLYCLWLLVFFVHHLFDPEIFRRSSQLYITLASSTLISIIIAVTYFYAQPALTITPRRFLLGHIGISMVFIAAWYSLIRFIWHTKIVRPVYVLQDSDLADIVTQLVDAFRFLGLRYYGPFQVSVTNRQILLPEALVVLPDHIRLQDTMIHELYNLRLSGIRFFTYSDFYEYLTRTIHLSALNELWFLEHVRYDERGLYGIVKRGIDVVASSIGLGVFILTFPIVALVIWLDSGGPFFFEQERVGQYGVPYTVYKYRTMRHRTANDTWTAPGDTRVTRVGKWLRKLRLDELPQAWNILKGDMSIVGPRPEQVHIVEQLRQQIPYYDERHIVKPGLTGWAQLHVYAASVEETKRKLQYDLYYIKHRSVWFDIEIILKTIYHIVSFQGK